MQCVLIYWLIQHSGFIKPIAIDHATPSVSTTPVTQVLSQVPSSVSDHFRAIGDYKSAGTHTTARSSVFTPPGSIWQSPDCKKSWRPHHIKSTRSFLHVRHRPQRLIS
jgi:hypothetical protein